MQSHGHPAPHSDGPPLVLSQHQDPEEVCMKLRRALATAAVTAAIAPAALLAAPAAFAEGPAGETVTSTDSQSSPAAPLAQSPSASSTAAVPVTNPSTATGTPTPTPTVSQTDPSGTPTPTATPTTTPPETPAPTASPEPAECEDGGEYAEDPDLSTSLAGLPSKVVAGSGFHGFEFSVRNNSDRSYQRVDFGVIAATADADNPEGTGKYLTLQFKNPDTGRWEAISTDADDQGQGYVGYTDVLPHETLKLDLRLSIAAAAPAGIGFAISVGVYADDEGNCVFSTGDLYEFDVLAAGAKPGQVPGAKPQGGKKPLPAKPAGDTRINPQGTLAATGSSSALPAIAMIGGVAMVAGAGAVFIVRRRRIGVGGAGGAAA
ncbi:LAETG motif-containing sortase-dependent surface protein [Streptomyces sp. H27-D2]|uniref:LAETG motif-containing sortase-dependent surface protein n=1 Tax=Streptomyces sp. H27-D2 TaxID=3046304 RepID=UPI002DB8EC9D|nr:LAETG motif-containing sortase-dependent surface protein [Streptomyces sp. H27-D2]MEC4017464.1 LAETG motif-containing sortase-dependent surface protein [Streptomyces sp. H27-D2]